MTWEILICSLNKIPFQRASSSFSNNSPFYCTYAVNSQCSLSLHLDHRQWNHCLPPMHTAEMHITTTKRAKLLTLTPLQLNKIIIITIISSNYHRLLVPPAPSTPSPCYCCCNCFQHASACQHYQLAIYHFQWRSLQLVLPSQQFRIIIILKMSLICSVKLLARLLCLTCAGVRMRQKERDG